MRIILKTVLTLPDRLVVSQAVDNKVGRTRTNATAATTNNTRMLPRTAVAL